MRYLILGQGGREHAIVRALKFSPTVTEIHAAPGSRGISQEAICHDVDLADPAAIEAFVRRYRFDCVIVGSPRNFVADLSDRLRGLDVAVVGPSRAALQLEQSPDFAAAFMTRAGVPPAPIDHAGEVISFAALINGEVYESLPPARNDRRLTEGDTGPDTEGMGAVAPHAIDETLRSDIVSRIVEPSVRQLVGEGLAYRGVLNLRVALTTAGPRALGYHVGFGDPETQVILPLLEGDWGRVFLDLAHGKLSPLRWSSNHAACVVAAAPGYPESPITGGSVDGDLGHQKPTSYFLHAGTTKGGNGQWVINGGRVLNAVGIGNSRAEALRAAYAQASRVNWKGLQVRRDIGVETN